MREGKQRTARHRLLSTPTEGGETTMMENNTWKVLLHHLMSEQRTQQLMASLKQNKEEITDTLESNRPWISGERKHENDRLYIISAILNIIQMLMVGHAALCPATQTKKMQTLERVFKQMQELNCACFAQFLANYQSRRTHQLLSAAGRNNYRGELRWVLTHLLTGEARTGGMAQGI